MAVRAVPALSALTLTAALTLGGCTAEPPPQSAPTTPASTSSTTPTTTAPSPTTSVDPVLAKIPPAARPNTQAGAEAFAKFFFERTAAALAAPKSGALDGLYVKTCKTCTAFNDSIAEMQRTGRHHARPTILVSSSSAERFTDEDSKKVIAVEVRQIAADILDENGNSVGRTRANQGIFVLTMTWRNHWTIDLAQVERKR